MNDKEKSVRGNKYRVAEIIHNEARLIVIFLDSTVFSVQDLGNRMEIRDSLQFLANDMGLPGLVCLVWKEGPKTKCLGPEEAKDALNSLHWDNIPIQQKRTLEVRYF